MSALALCTLENSHLKHLVQRFWTHWARRPVSRIGNLIRTVVRNLTSTSNPYNLGWSSTSSAHTKHTSCLLWAPQNCPHRTRNFLLVIWFLHTMPLPSPLPLLIVWQRVRLFQVYWLGLFHSGERCQDVTQSRNYPKERLASLFFLSLILGVL